MKDFKCGMGLAGDEGVSVHTSMTYRLPLGVRPYRNIRSEFTKKSIDSRLLGFALQLKVAGQPRRPTAIDAVKLPVEDQLIGDVAPASPERPR